VLEGLGVRVEERGSVARRLEEVERFPVKWLELEIRKPGVLRERRGAPVVLCEHCDDLVGAVSHAVLDEAPDLEVLGAAHRLRQHSVRDVADQHVLERILLLAG
jgi:hypothetical protein